MSARARARRLATRCKHTVLWDEDSACGARSVIDILESALLLAEARSLDAARVACRPFTTKWACIEQLTTMRDLRLTAARRVGRKGKR